MGECCPTNSSRSKRSHAVTELNIPSLSIKVFPGDLGDIGRHFPDTDPAYKGADSLVLLDHVMALLDEAGWQVGNVDATILAQKPKLAPHIPQMRDNLARHMGVAPEQINVKATTEEKLGFTGAEQGIAAHAVCLLEKRK